MFTRRIFMLCGLFFGIQLVSAQAGSTPEVQVHFQPADNDNIRDYEAWAAKIEDKNAQRGLEILIDAMKKGRMPTEFLTWDMKSEDRVNNFILEPLFFDTKFSAEFRSDEDLICNKAGPIGRSHTSIIVTAATNKAGSNINCGFGNDLYFLSDETDVVDDGWGDDIFSTGRGSDKILAHWGRDIFILEKGWGSETIEKNCGGSRPNEKSKIYTNLILDSVPHQQLTDYKSPYKYTNYIVFGPGIKEQDMYWDNARLVNRITGDEIRFKGRCFNLIYTDK